MAPEYLSRGIFSFKSDVFSFGVIVLEILSGKRNIVFNQANIRLNLLGHVSTSVNAFTFSVPKCCFQFSVWFPHEHGSAGIQTVEGR